MPIAAAAPLRRPPWRDDRCRIADCSQEIAALRDAVAAVCPTRAAPWRRPGRGGGDHGHAEALAGRSPTQIGLGGLGLPEESGGLGGLAEIVAVGGTLGAA